MRAYRQRAALLLVPAGVLAAHLLGWLTVGGENHDGHHAVVGHGHLAALAALAVPLALAGLAVAARDGYHGRRTPVRLAAIAAGQVACFVVLEAAEAAVAGTGATPALGQPALWAGLALQVAVAWALRALLRTSAAAGYSMRRWRPPVARLRLAGPRPVAWPGATRPAGSPASRRGPPRLLLV